MLIVILWYYRDEKLEIYQQQHVQVTKCEDLVNVLKEIIEISRLFFKVNLFFGLVESFLKINAFGCSQPLKLLI